MSYVVGCLTLGGMCVGQVSRVPRAAARRVHTGTGTGRTPFYLKSQASLIVDCSRPSDRVIGVLAPLWWRVGV